MADTSSAYEDSTVYDWPKILGQKDKECSKEIEKDNEKNKTIDTEADIVDSSSCCLLYTSPSPRDQRGSRMPSSA